MKQTRQKSMILENVMNRHDHPTAEMVYRNLKEIDPNLSLATVYRNLNTFAEKGLIRKIELPNQKDHFDFNTHMHDHAVCTECQSVLDLPTRIVHKPRNLEQFKVTQVQVLYYGVCEECQNKIKKSS